jgi:hypothetical protein
MEGQIASLYGQREGRTLENYCHDQIATAENKLRPGCPLYSTKPENVPPSLIGAIDAAEMLRRYKLRGVLPPITELTAWEFCAFDTAEEASDEITAEDMKKADGTAPAANPTPLGVSGEIEKNGAMSGW